ncbi:Las1-domain-containing protein [Mytilinidion resinicola]|uniref:Las1-domain-containing protein n=1 Tax=Mytilinidion resinicola TaxID=574789 RepID=A0A6A6YCE8_9PEZI|nr:Las1-domain-containing protein [Mytilinidion resinicola]KAF2806506.1 Las1-domain-containing protein [Mytilinidion resinicola]
MPRFTVTPWRDPAELMKVRGQLYQFGEFEHDDRRQEAVNQVLAWRTRKADFPLALESTCVLVEATVQDGGGVLSTHSVRMLYASAISRFVTGFCDTTQETSYKQSMHQRAAELKLPISLVEIRHEITHRDLPSLIRLRENAKKSLDWLWRWYWLQLEVMFDTPDETSRQRNLDEARDALQATLNTYVTARIDDVRNKTTQNSARANVACAEIIRICQGKEECLQLLAEILTTPSKKAKCLIPADKALSSSMDGAYLIWDKLLVQLHTHQVGFLSILLAQMVDYLGEPSTQHVSYEPTKDALFEWIIHLLSQKSWKASLGKSQITLTEEVLAKCLLSVTTWTTKLAEALVTKGDKSLQKGWMPLVDIAQGRICADARSNCPPTKDTEAPPARKGWTRCRGLWPQSAIGALPRETDYQNQLAVKKLIEEAGIQEAEQEDLEVE